MISNVERVIKKSLEKAMEKGMAKGIEKVVPEMLKKGSDQEIIASCTGLSREEIEKLN